MNNRGISLIFIFCAFLLICTGCTTEVTMPHSSDEYKTLNWSIDELIAHFEELGFSDIETDVWETFDESQVRTCRVAIEDPSADSWFTEYKDFERGEVCNTYLKVYISAYKLIPTITVDNCAEFSQLVTMDNDSSERAELLSSFMEKHSGEYIEFSGTINNWHDEWWFIVGIDFSIAVENSNELSFGWDDISLSDLKMTGKYHYTNYSVGLISEGMPVHMIAKIKNSDDGWSLQIDSMQIIE